MPHSVFPAKDMREPFHNLFGCLQRIEEIMGPELVYEKEE